MIKVSTAPELPYDFEDFGMTEQELHDKHNPTGDGGEHPHYTREEWVNAVNQDATLAGYWAWVYGEVQRDNDEFPDTSDEV